MKIGLINNLYPPYDKGGTEKVTELIADELQKQGRDVFIVTTKPPFSQKPKKEKKTYHLSSLYYHLNKIPKPLRLFWHWWDMRNPGNTLSLSRILDKEAPDAVISNNLKGVSGLTPRLLKKKGIFHIHILHDIQLLHPGGLLLPGREKKLDSPLTRYYIRKQKRLWGSPDAVISPSNWLLELHKKYGFFPKSKKMVLPNPLPATPRIDNITEKENNRIKFLYVGQIEEHKGILFLADTFREHAPSRAELLIIGGGSKESELKGLISGNNKIKFLGKKGKEEVKQAMKKADCLVMPSRCYENSPTVIYEAIEAGLPVLASDLGGTPEIARMGAGLTFSPTEKKELASGLEKVAHHLPELKAEAEEKRKKIKELEPKRYVKELISLIES